MASAQAANNRNAAIQKIADACSNHMEQVGSSAADTLVNAAVLIRI